MLHTAFDFNNNLILENEVAMLRPLQNRDFVHLKHFANELPDIWQYSREKVWGEYNLQEYISKAVKSREDKKEFPFIVFDNRKNEYAGSTRFYDIQFENKTLQLGYTWYGKEFQRTGLNKHCKFLMLQFAFEIFDMERVEFRADNNNLRSIEAMKKIGCKIEGVLRSNLPTQNNARRDSIVLSILKDEWLNNVKTDLKNQL
ncbi:MAG: GNAT family protein [Daejeonella sp.]